MAACEAMRPTFIYIHIYRYPLYSSLSSADDPDKLDSHTLGNCHSGQGVAQVHSCLLQRRSWVGKQMTVKWLCDTIYMINNGPLVRIAAYVYTIVVYKYTPVQYTTYNMHYTDHACTFVI